MTVASYQFLFCGDPADGVGDHGLASIEYLCGELPSDATLYRGHGEPCGIEVRDWRADYINTLLDALTAVGWADAGRARKSALDRMRDHVPSSTPRFLMQLAIAPVVRKFELGT